jgi:hypothetical protein
MLVMEGRRERRGDGHEVLCFGEETVVGLYLNVEGRGFGIPAGAGVTAAGLVSMASSSVFLDRLRSGEVGEVRSKLERR